MSSEECTQSHPSSPGSEEGGLSWETHLPPVHTRRSASPPHRVPQGSTPPSSGPRQDPGEQAGKDAEGRRPEAGAGVGWGEPET